MTLRNFDEFFRAALGEKYSPFDYQRRLACAECSGVDPLQRFYDSTLQRFNRRELNGCAAGTNANQDRSTFRLAAARRPPSCWRGYGIASGKDGLIGHAALFIACRCARWSSKQKRVFAIGSVIYVSLIASAFTFSWAVRKRRTGTFTPRLHTVASYAAYRHLRAHVSAAPLKLRIGS
jgi:hypothetical protein